MDSFQGFIFATIRPEVPSFQEYLGYVGRKGANIPAAA